MTNERNADAAGSAAALPGMPRGSLLYAWEFGANYGHLGRFLTVAPALREHGYRMHCAVSNTESAARLLHPRGFSWLAAPTPAERPSTSPPLSYPDILLRFGYDNEDTLLGQVVAWRELMRNCAARVVLADHAPTATLASRSLGIPVMIFSSGFSMPPLSYPLPALRPWQGMTDAQLIAIETRVLSVINRVLARLDGAPLAQLWQLFDVAERALMTFPELDHYDDRGPATYWGIMPDSSIGAAPEWPAVAGKRLFAYLRQETPQLEAILNALRRCGLPTVVYFPGMAEVDRQAFQTPSLRFLDKPADLPRVAREADAAVTYASPAATTAFLLQGKPVMMIPSQLEQFLFARRVAQMGAGLLINPESPPPNMDVPLHTLLNNPDLAANAALFAAKYAAFPQHQVVGNLVRRIDEICAGEHG